MANNLTKLGASIGNALLDISDQLQGARLQVSKEAEKPNLKAIAPGNTIVKFFIGSVALTFR